MSCKWEYSSDTWLALIVTLIQNRCGLCFIIRSRKKILWKSSSRSILSVTLHPLSQIPLTFTRRCERPLGNALLSLPSSSILLMFFLAFSHPPVVSAPSFSPSSASLRICVTRVDFGGWMWGWAAGRQKSGRRRWKKGNDDILSSEKKAKEGKPETFRDLSQRLFFISLFWFEESSNSTLINLLLTAAASCLQRDNHW